MESVDTILTHIQQVRGQDRGDLNTFFHLSHAIASKLLFVKILGRKEYILYLYTKGNMTLKVLFFFRVWKKSCFQSHIRLKHFVIRL